MRRKWENYGVKLEIAKRDLAKRDLSTPLSAKVGNAYNSPGSLIKIIRPGKIRAEGDRTLRFTEPNRTLVKRDSYRTEPNKRAKAPNRTIHRTEQLGNRPNRTQPNRTTCATEPNRRFGSAEGSVAKPKVRSAST